MVEFPKLHKKINAFLIGEEGKISKETLFKTGVFASSMALAALLSAQGAQACAHSNSLTLSASGSGVTGGHAHHCNSATGTGTYY